NLVPVIASNRIGIECSKGDPGWCITFYGSSFICDETGAMLQVADRDDETILVQSFDLAAIRARRDAWGIFRDRRPDCYRALLGADGAIE
ncbi:MAG TPA: N-carbamoylputrescine amidase, partial [Spongiibacteraceae bacterium]|nr:N-carbamoylputrescine amidase [Spongiibacteraceae bacterium]